MADVNRILLTLCACHPKGIDDVLGKTERNSFGNLKRPALFEASSMKVDMKGASNKATGSPCQIGS